MNETDVSQAFDALAGLPGLADRAIAAAATLMERLSADKLLTPSLAFLSGGLAVAMQARLAILGAGVVATAGGAPFLGFALDPGLAGALQVLGIALVLLGLLQGGLTSLLGEEAGGQLVVLGIAGFVLLLVWRAPKALLRKLIGRIP